MSADDRIATLPNILTAGRIVAAALLGLIFVLLPRPAADMAALALFVAAAVTDFFDGWLARRLNQMSDLGRALDPIADKALVFAAFVALLLSAPNWSLPWLAVAFVAVTLRDFLVSGFREAVGSRGVVLHATGLAKAKTALQMTALPVLLAAPLLPAADSARLAGLALLLLATVLTIVTGVGYARAALRALAGGGAEGEPR